jgi:hypothetical protein
LILAAFYLVVLSFLFEHKIVKEIIKTFVRDGEKKVSFITQPVIKERIIRKPVFYELEKPIIKEVITPVDRPVLLRSDRKNKKYAYIGSSQTKVFHKKNCRFGKLIKKKYKVLGNDLNYFIAKDFKSCKVCMQKEKGF